MEIVGIISGWQGRDPEEEWKESMAVMVWGVAKVSAKSWSSVSGLTSRQRVVGMMVVFGEVRSVCVQGMARKWSRFGCRFEEEARGRGLVSDIVVAESAN